MSMAQYQEQYPKRVESRAVIVSFSAIREISGGSTHKGLKDLFSPWAIGCQYDTFTS